MLMSCQNHAMANLQVKNVPELLYLRLKQVVRAQDRTLSDFVLRAVERESARVAFHKQLAQRPRTDLGLSAASLLEETRRERSEEWP